MNNYQGKTFLIGIDFIDDENELIEQYQTSGVVVKIEKDIIKLRRKNQSIYSIPNDRESIKKAALGIYKEKTTEKIVVENPDFISQWRIYVKNFNDIDKYKKIGFEPSIS